MDVPQRDAAIWAPTLATGKEGGKELDCFLPWRSSHRGSSLSSSSGHSGAMSVCFRSLRREPNELRDAAVGRKDSMQIVSVPLFHALMLPYLSDGVTDRWQAG